MEHPIGNLMDTTMNKIKEMVDVNTIVGEPITAPGWISHCQTNPRYHMHW